MAGRKRVGLKSKAYVAGNIRPLVTLLLVMPCLFMAGVSFSRPDGILASSSVANPNQLAGKKIGAPTPATRLIIKLERRGTHTMASLPGMQTEDLSGELYHRLQAQRHVLGKDVQVLIKPSKDVPFHDLITVYSDCKRAQYRHIVFFADSDHVGNTVAARNAHHPNISNGFYIADGSGKVIINVVSRPGDASGKQLAPKIVIWGKNISFGRLTSVLSRLRSAEPRLNFILRADETMRYKYVSQVLEDCASASISSIHFMTKRPNS